MCFDPCGVTLRNVLCVFLRLLVASLGVVHIIVHLNAHDAVKRVREVELVLEQVHKYTRAGLPVLVMGDMNTLIPRDAEWHEVVLLI